MSRSDVFDEFIKIAVEKGLVSEAEAEHTEQNTKNPRWDSLDISAIEALYGVKPDQSKNMDYEHNIMEVAHPSPKVIAPSYDKLNGLVENEMERQNINMHIVFKEPMSGSPNQGMYPMQPTMLYPNIGYATPKYASKDLMLSLVRVANDMDNKDKDELRILADTCLEQLHLGFKKQAFLPWLIGAGALLAALYWQQHGDDRDQGLEADYKNLVEELNNLSSSSVSWWMGESFDDQVKKSVSDVEAQLREFIQSYETLMAKVDVKDAKDLASKSTTEGAKFADALERLPAIVQNLTASLNSLKQHFSDIDYKAQHTTEKGGITSLLDSIPGLHGGNTAITGDKFDGVINAIGPFEESMSRFMNGSYKKLYGIANHLTSSISSDIASNTKAPEAPVAPAAPKGRNIQDIEEEASGIGKDLEGLTDFLPGLGG